MENIIIPTLVLDGKYIEENKLPIKMYVCGITPYKISHLGHISTFLTFDLIHRFYKYKNIDMLYIQNMTDIDIPLLEYCQETQKDCDFLIQDNKNKYIQDMNSINILPPTFLIMVSSMKQKLQILYQQLLENGKAYSINNDLYFSMNEYLQYLPLNETDAIEQFRNNGGDPDKKEKKHPLDPIIYNASLDMMGWHVGCSCIINQCFPHNNNDKVLLCIQGGGKDLRFPHHFYCSCILHSLTLKKMAIHNIHTGLIYKNGQKMSKSLDNMIYLKDFTSPVCIRFALLKYKNYYSDLDWEKINMDKVESDLVLLRNAFSKQNNAPVKECIQKMVTCIANNLDTIGAIQLLLAWAQETVQGDFKTQDLSSLDIKKFIQDWLGIYI